MTTIDGHVPIVGLTTYLQQASSGVWNVPASFLPAYYLNGVTMAGGIATLLPPQSPSDRIVGRVLSGIDGLIVTGGSDVNPSSYGQVRHYTTDNPALDRDAWEFALVRGAIARRLPLLGICRGAQVLNVALGGTLHQHLPDILQHTRHQAGSAVFSTTSINTVAGTRVAQLVGEAHEAQCYHHQAIAGLGEGLIVSARDGEGVIEAIEGDPLMYPKSWIVAVQWHPEQTLHDLSLFEGLVEAARVHRFEVDQSPRC